MCSNTLQTLNNEGQPELAFLDSPKHQKHWRKGQERGHSITKGGCTLQNKSPPFSQLMRSIRGKSCFIVYNAVTRPSLKIFPSSQSISETSPPSLMSSGDFAQLKSRSKMQLGAECLLGTAPLPRQLLIQAYSRLQIN